MADQTKTLKIEGMSCGHCIAAVRTALEDAQGIAVEDVQMGTARVRYDSDRVSEEDLGKIIEEEGYTLSSLEPV